MSRYLLFAMSPGGGEKRLLKGINYLGKRNDSRGNVAVNIAERKKKGNIFIRFFPRPLFLGDAIMSRAGKLCMHSGKGWRGQFGKEKIAFSAVGALREGEGEGDISLPHITRRGTLHSLMCFAHGRMQKFAHNTYMQSGAEKKFPPRHSESGATGFSVVNFFFA